MKNRSVPVSTVLPHLVYRDVAEACDWLTRVFGFKEHFRYRAAGERDSDVSGRRSDHDLPAPVQRTQSPAVGGCDTRTLTIVVPNVDAHYAKSREEGATIWEELHKRSMEKDSTA